MTLKKPKAKGGAKSKGVKKNRMIKIRSGRSRIVERRTMKPETRFSPPLLPPRPLRQQRHSTDLILPIPCSQLLYQDIMPC
ncbi:hypothetical protein BYT27DRAFT_7193485 [Phlegmacium glaucopus]|nr:hypothetical protein BYT27DRAFT_7193485 [Phlegmacium glaucopus]